MKFEGKNVHIASKVNIGENVKIANTQKQKSPAAKKAAGLSKSTIQKLGKHHAVIIKFFLTMLPEHF